MLSTTYRSSHVAAPVTRTADRAFALDGEAKRLVGELRARKYQLGAVLGVIRQQQLYRLLGTPTWDAYLAQPELGLSRRSAQLYIQAYESFAPFLQPADAPPDPDRPALDAARLERIGISKAVLVAPMLQAATVDEQNAWLDKSEHLTRDDLRLEIDRARGGVEDPILHHLQMLARSMIGLLEMLAEVDDADALILEIEQRLEAGRVYLARLKAAPGAPPSR